MIGKKPAVLAKVMTGGRTGIDQAALAVALRAGLPCSVDIRPDALVRPA